MTTLRIDSGQPRSANVSISVALVDKAVLVLADAYGTQQNLVDVFYERLLGVNCSRSLSSTRITSASRLTEGNRVAAVAVTASEC